MVQENNEYTPRYNLEFADDHTLTNTDPVEPPLSVGDVKASLNRNDNDINFQADLEQGNLGIDNKVVETEPLINSQLNSDLTNNYGYSPEQNFINQLDCPEGFWGRFCKKFGFKVPDNIVSFVDEYKIWCISGFIIVFLILSLVLIYTKNLNALKVIWYILLCFLGFFECSDNK